MCRIDPETSSTFFENESYKKYGKTGKTFYLSQVASTVRWLSTANATDITSRLPTTGQSQTPTSKKSTEIEPSSSSSISPSISDMNMKKEKDPEIVASGNTYNDIKLPPIPSFSEFVNKKSTKEYSKPSPLKRSKFQ